MSREEATYFFPGRDLTALSNYGQGKQLFRVRKPLEIDHVIVYFLPAARMASIRRGRMQPSLRIRCSFGVVFEIRIALPYL